MRRMLGASRAQVSSFGAGHHKINSGSESGNSESEVQTNVAAQLTEALTKQIRFVSPAIETETNNTTVRDNIGIYLFKQSKEQVLGKDLDRLKLEQTILKKMKKPKLKKRKLQGESTSDDESIKLKAAAVSAEWVVRKGY